MPLRVVNKSFTAGNNVQQARKDFSAFAIVKN